MKATLRLDAPPAPGKTVKVRAHTRKIVPKPKAPVLPGYALGGGIEDPNQVAITGPASQAVPLTADAPFAPISRQGINPGMSIGPGTPGAGPAIIGDGNGIEGRDLGFSNSPYKTQAAYDKAQLLKEAEGIADDRKRFSSHWTNTPAELAGRFAALKDQVGSLGAPAAPSAPDTAAQQAVADQQAQDQQLASQRARARKPTPVETLSSALSDFRSGVPGSDTALSAANADVPYSSVWPQSGYAKGGGFQHKTGKVTGGTKGKDSVPILAMPDEYMLPAPTAHALGGPPALDNLVRQTTGQNPGPTPVKMTDGQMMQGRQQGGEVQGRSLGGAAYNDPDALAREYQRQMGIPPASQAPVPAPVSPPSNGVPYSDPAAVADSYTRQMGRSPAVPAVRQPLDQPPDPYQQQMNRAPTVPLASPDEGKRRADQLAPTPPPSDAAPTQSVGPAPKGVGEKILNFFINPADASSEVPAAPTEDFRAARARLRKIPTTPEKIARWGMEDNLSSVPASVPPQYAFNPQAMNAVASSSPTASSDAAQRAKAANIAGVSGIPGRIGLPSESTGRQRAKEQMDAVLKTTRDSTVSLNPADAERLGYTAANAERIGLGVGTVDTSPANQKPPAAPEPPPPAPGSLQMPPEAVGQGRQRPASIFPDRSTAGVLPPGIVRSDNYGNPIYMYVPKDAAEKQEFGKAIFSDSARGATPKGFNEDIAKHGQGASGAQDWYNGVDVSQMSPTELQAFKTQGQREVNNIDLARRWLAIPEGNRPPPPPGVQEALGGGVPASQQLSLAVENRTRGQQAVGQAQAVKLKEAMIKAEGEAGKGTANRWASYQSSIPRELRAIGKPDPNTQDPGLSDEGMQWASAKISQVLPYLKSTGELPGPDFLHTYASVAKAHIRPKSAIIAQLHAENPKLTEADLAPLIAAQQQQDQARAEAALRAMSQ